MENAAAPSHRMIGCPCPGRICRIGVGRGVQIHEIPHGKGRTGTEGDMAVQKGPVQNPYANPCAQETKLMGLGNPQSLQTLQQTPVCGIHLLGRRKLTEGIGSGDFAGSGKKGGRSRLPSQEDGEEGEDQNGAGPQTAVRPGTHLP